MGSKEFSNSCLVVLSCCHTIANKEASSKSVLFFVEPLATQAAIWEHSARTHVSPTHGGSVHSAATVDIVYEGTALHHILLREALLRESRGSSQPCHGSPVWSVGHKPREIRICRNEDDITVVLPTTQRSDNQGLTATHDAVIWQKLHLQGMEYNYRPLQDFAVKNDNTFLRP